MSNTYTIDESRSMAQFSKKTIGFICKICDSYSEIQARKIKNRSNGFNR